MPTVSMLARADLRHRWRSVLAAGLLVGLAAAFTLTAALGALRSRTVVHRFDAATLAPDLVVFAPTLSAGDQVLAVALADPDVVAATGLHWSPVGPAGPGLLQQYGTFMPLNDQFGSTIYRPLLRAGRQPDQHDPGEATVNEPLARLLHLHVGDTVPVASVDGVGNQVLLQDVTVVGIHFGPIDAGVAAGNAMMQVTTAFRDRWLATVDAGFPAGGTESGTHPFILVRTRPGADAPAVAARIVAASPAGTNTRGGQISDAAGTAVGYISWGFALLAAAAALATGVVGLQVTGRLVRRRSADGPTLAALGATTRERTLALAAPGLACAGVAVVTALGVAVPTSTLVPTGLARRVEPDPGIWLTPAALTLGALGLGLLLGAGALVTAARARLERDPRPSGPAPAWLARGGVVAGLGWRAALGSGSAAGPRRQARSAILAAAVAGLGLASVLVVTASTAKAIDGPRSWGYGFDRAFEVGALGSSTEEQARITAAAEVGGLSEALLANVPVGGTSFEAQEIRPLRGDALPVLVSGRAPRSADEVAVGGPLLREAHLHVGGDLTVDGGRTLRVVGTAAAPSLGDGDFGYVLWAGPGALERLGIAPTDRYLLVSAADGVPPARLDEIVANRDGGSDPFPPPAVTNLRQIGRLPVALAAFLTLLAVGSLAHALLSSIRSRRRDLAILRSLGFVRRQVRGTVRWQAVAAIAVGLAIGLPLGVVTGSVVWRRLADTIGIPADTAVSVAGLAVVMAALLAAALLVSWWPARRAAATRPAETLRTE